MREAKAPRQAATIFIFVTLVLDTMAGGIAAPVLPKLVGQLGHSDPAQVAEIFGVFGTMFFVTQFFAAPLQGALSDAFGRRPVILISAAGMAADFMVMALAPNLGWLYASRLVAGITAGSIAAATAYFIDVTPPEGRTRIFGLAGAAMSVGTAFGPALGGLAGSYNLRLPFWIAAGLGLLSLLYGWFVLPESLSAERRATFRWANANPVGATIGIARAYPALLWWGLAIFLFALSQMGVNSIYAVYTSYRYLWSPRAIGLYLSAVGIWSIVVQALLLPLMIKRLSDRAMLIGRSILQAVCIAGAGLMPNGIGYGAFAFVWIAGLVMMSASLNTIMSQQVGPSDQGRMQGAARSLGSVVGLIAPGLFALMLANAIRFGGRPLSGAPYVVSGVVAVVALAVVMRAMRAGAAAKK
jgi:DHA1 family tetracycline resistance protein-like MFS transporter